MSQPIGNCVTLGSVFIFLFFQEGSLSGAHVQWSIMNYCISDTCEIPHVSMGSSIQASVDPWSYPGEGPEFGHCEPQRLHHPPCMEQPWLPSQHYMCMYDNGTSLFDSESCNIEMPPSHWHHQPEYFPELKADLSQWMQGMFKKGRSPGCVGCFCLLSSCVKLHFVLFVCVST